MIKPRRLTILIAALVAVAALAALVSACGEDDDGGTASGEQAESAESAPRESQQDIVVLAQGERNLSTLVKAVGAAKLVDTLKGEGPFTVFSPTNQAFAAL